MSAASVPRYVKFLEKRPQNNWFAYNFQFVTYDKDFSLSCAQAIMDEAGRMDNATRIRSEGGREEDLTAQLNTAGRKIRACASFLENNYAMAMGVLTRNMMVKTFLYPGTNRITVMVCGPTEDESVSTYINELIHKAISG